MNNLDNLPNADRALVEHEKIKEYLLNPTHPDGAGKARFFVALGFRRQDWKILAEALRTLAQTAPVAKSIASPHGQKYIVDGIIRSPRGKTAMIRTVWITDEGQDRPRLVTAYPKE